MKTLQVNRNGRKFNTIKRKALNLSQEDLVTVEALPTGQCLPKVCRPKIDNVNVIKWASENRDYIRSLLLKHGGVLFRNFHGVQDAAALEQFLHSLSGDLLDYVYGSSPRNLVDGKIYTSTEYPAHRSILLHNEMSYSRAWPMKIAFLCVQPAARGGETPVVDSRRVFERISPKIREKFMAKYVMYVRNYGTIDVPWQDVFQTTDKRSVEEFCYANGLSYEWLDAQRLRTKQVCQSICQHPQTGEMVWFNQAHIFHPSCMEPTVRDTLLTEFGEENLPRNVLYGDGSPIEDSIIDEINGIYQQEQLTFTWQKGDILLLDNMLIAHGRAPFEGERQILVGMIENHSLGAHSLFS